MDEDAPAPRKFTFKDKEFARENVRATPPAPSVHEILRDNLAVQKSVEPEVIPNLKDRRTKRRNDFIILLVAGNLLGVLLGIVVPSNVVTVVYLLAYFVIFNIALVWVMYQVMDKY